MGCQIRRFFSWLLLLGTIVLGISIGLGILNPSSAEANIRKLEEAPGQMVYQSRQRLIDRQGNSWQTVAFKRIRPDGSNSFELRLVGFPGLVEIDRSQPITLRNSLGTSLQATDASKEIFIEASQPEANVGQYNLQPLLSQLKAEIPWQLTLPTVKGDEIRLSLPPSLIQEWQKVANS